MQESLDKVRNVFLGIFTLFCITLIPFSICESIISYDLIKFVYGDKWLESVPIMMVLSLAMIFYPLTALQGPVLAGLGKPQIELKIQWLVLGFALILFAIVIHTSVIIIAWSVFILYISRFFALSLATYKALFISIKDVKKIIISILWFSFPVILSITITGWYSTELSLIIRLLLQGLITTLVWGMMFLLGWNRILPSQFQDLIYRFMPLKILIRFNLLPEQK
jgi:PST family polysaccharide transporter